MCRTAASAIGDLLLRTNLTKRQMAPAMHERPRPLRSNDFVQPVIPVIGVALQVVSAKAVQELLSKGTAATGAYRNSTIGGLGPLWPRSSEAIAQK